MTYLTLNVVPNIVEILMKNTSGEVFRLDVPKAMQEKNGVKIMSGDLSTNAEITLNSGDFEYKTVLEEVAIKRNESFRIDSEQTELQDSILGDLEVSRMLPSLEQIRDKIGRLGVETEVKSEQSYEDRELGLPTLAELRKRL